MRNRGFTLIELLIVVAIIAILAAIAVPNFLEAQTRAKVSRAKADIRSMATAVEAYRIDYNAYPNDTGNGWPWYIPNAVSTPVSYITNAALYDPFRAHLTHTYAMRFRYVNYIAGQNAWCDWGVQFGSCTDGVATGGWILSIRNSLTRPDGWAEAQNLFATWKMSSAGPDRTASFPFLDSDLIYDPTNGTVSAGDIIRSQAEPEASQHDAP
jgi:prepilin-type N-terminal cleavage/methylation domain-containing protein